MDGALFWPSILAIPPYDATQCFVQFSFYILRCYVTTGIKPTQFHPFSSSDDDTSDGLVYIPQKECDHTEKKRASQFGVENDSDCKGKDKGALHKSRRLAFIHMLPITTWRY